MSISVYITNIIFKNLEKRKSSYRCGKKIKFVTKIHLHFFFFSSFTPSPFFFSLLFRLHTIFEMIHQKSINRFIVVTSESGISSRHPAETDVQCEFQFEVHIRRICSTSFVISKNKKEDNSQQLRQIQKVSTSGGRLSI